MNDRKRPSSIGMVALWAAGAILLLIGFLDLVVIAPWWLEVPLGVIILALAAAAFFQVSENVAEPFGLRAWAMMRAREGHPELADALSQRAFADDLDELAKGRRMGDEEAEILYRHALAIRERVLGETQPDTIATVEHLAAVYRRLHQPAKADLFDQRAQKARKVVEAARRSGIGLVVQTDDVAWIFSSIADAEGHLEGQDAAGGDYPRAYDPDGRIYDIAPRKAFTVAITPIPDTPPDTEALRQLLVRFLKAQGARSDDNENHVGSLEVRDEDPLEDLLERAARFVER